LPLVNGFVDDSLRNTDPSVNEPLLQLVNAVFDQKSENGSETVEAEGIKTINIKYQFLKK